MPKKKRHESQATQSARFKAEVEKLIAAGELNPIDAEAALEALVREGAAKTLDPGEPGN